MYRNLLSSLYELDMNGTYLNFDCGHTVVSVQRVGQSSNLKHSVVMVVCCACSKDSRSVSTPT